MKQDIRQVLSDLEQHGDPRAMREKGCFLSKDDVEARLVEAVRVTWRLGDREAGWQRMGSGWPQVLRHTWFGDYPDFDAVPRPLPLSRVEIADSEAALDWLAAVEVEQDRRIVALALRALAGGAARVPWIRMLQPLGLRRGSDRLRRRYGMAMVLVTKRANGMLACERLPEKDCAGSQGGCAG